MKTMSNKQFKTKIIAGKLVTVPVFNHTNEHTKFSPHEEPFKNTIDQRKHGQNTYGFTQHHHHDIIGGNNATQLSNARLEAQRNKHRALQQTYRSVLSPQPEARPYAEGTIVKSDPIVQSIVNSISPFSRFHLMSTLSAMKRLDPNGNGLLSVYEVQDALVAYNIYLDQQVSSTLFEKFFNRNSTGDMVNYQRLWKYIMDCYALKDQILLTNNVHHHTKSYSAAVLNQSIPEHQQKQRSMPPGLHAELQHELRQYARMNQQLIQMHPLEDMFYSLDPYRSGKVLKSQVLRVCGQYLPGINTDVMLAVVNACDHDQSGLVNYGSLLKLLHSAQPTYLPPLSTAPRALISSDESGDSFNGGDRQLYEEEQRHVLDYLKSLASPPQRYDKVISQKQQQQYRNPSNIPTGHAKELEAIGNIGLHLSDFETKVHSRKSPPPSSAAELSGDDELKRPGTYDLEPRDGKEIERPRTYDLGPRKENVTNLPIITSPNLTSHNSCDLATTTNITSQMSKIKSSEETTKYNIASSVVINAASSKSTHKLTSSSSKSPRSNPSSIRRTWGSTVESTTAEKWWKKNDGEFSDANTVTQRKPWTHSPKIKTFKSRRKKRNKKGAMKSKENGISSTDTDCYTTTDVEINNFNNGGKFPSTTDDDEENKVKSIIMDQQSKQFEEQNSNDIKQKVSDQVRTETEQKLEDQPPINGTTPVLDTNDTSYHNTHIEKNNTKDGQQIGSTNHNNRRNNNKNHNTTNNFEQNQNTKSRNDQKDKNSENSNFDNTNNDNNENTKDTKTNMQIIDDELMMTSLSPSEPQQEQQDTNLINVSCEAGQNFSRKLQLEWIYGCNSSSLCMISQQQLVYHVGRVVVVMDTKEQHQRFFRKHRNDVTSLCCNRQEKVIASAQKWDGKKYVIHVWSAVDMVTVHTLHIERVKAHGVISVLKLLKVDNKLEHLLMLISAESEQEICLFDINEKNRVISLKISNCVGLTSCVKNFGCFATFGKNGHLYLHQYENDAVDSKMAEYGDIPIPKCMTSAVFESSGNIITGDNQGVIYLWCKMYMRVNNVVRNGHASSISTLVITKDNCLVSGSLKHSRLKVWDDGLKLVDTYEIPSELIGVRAFDVRDDVIVMTTSTNDITMLKLKPCNGSNIVEDFKDSFTMLVEGHSDIISCIAPHPAYEEMLSSLAADGCLNMYNVNTKKSVFNVRIQGNGSYMVYHPKKEYIFVGCHDGSVHLINTTVGSHVDKFKDAFTTISCLQTSEDGSYLYCGTRDGDLLTYAFDEHSAELELIFIADKILEESIRYIDVDTTNTKLRLQSTGSRLKYVNAMDGTEVEKKPEICWLTKTCSNSLEVKDLWCPDDSTGKQPVFCVANKNDMIASVERHTLSLVPSLRGEEKVKTSYTTSGCYDAALPCSQVRFSLDDNRLFLSYEKDCCLWQWKIVDDT